MDDPTAVSLSELRQVLNRLIDDLRERNGGDQIELTADYYWVLDPRDMYDVTAAPDPSRMTLGQLSDDVPVSGTGGRRSGKGRTARRPVRQPRTTTRLPRRASAHRVR